jgi:hypothetical protein
MTTLDRLTLARVGRIMDQGTDSDGWDVGIMEELWQLLVDAGLTAQCEHCGFDYCVASTDDGTCPFEFCDGPDEEEEDDDDDEAAGG